MTSHTSRHRARRAALVALAAPLLALGLPALASAGTATSDGRTVGFTDPAGAKDDLAVTVQTIALDQDPDGIGGWRTSFLQYAPPTSPGAGCATGFVSTVCASGVGPPSAVSVDLGGGDDDLVFTTSTPYPEQQVTILGGAGNDRVETYQTRATIDGGLGDDLIRPDDRPSVLASPPEPTPGGVIRGGVGIDTVDYDNALDPISVSLDGSANDGRPGEGDNVMPDVERVVASQYGGTFVGSDARNDIHGGSGNDRIAGGGGVDDLSGAAGNDTIDALDGAPGDRVDCGEGADVASADAGDIVAAGTCEAVVWAPAVRAKTLRVARGRIALVLACPPGTATCQGTVRLTKASPPRTTIAKAGYRVRSGTRSTIALKPGTRGRAAIERARVLAAVATVQPAGTTVRSGRAVRIRR